MEDLFVEPRALYPADDEGGGLQRSPQNFEILAKIEEKK